MKKTLTILLCLMMVSFKPTKHQILFIGDSLTAYDNGWQDKVAKGLDRDYVNLSVGGKRTDWMLKRLTEHLNQNSKYERVIIYGGINDAFSRRRNGMVVSDVQSMVDLCNQKGIKPIVIIGYNPDKVNRNTMYSEKITREGREKYMLIQLTLVSRLQNCQIVPMDNTIDRTDSDDGIHLKASGHRKFAKWVLKQLEM